MVFHGSLSDSKSPQVSRTRLRILAVLSNAVVWIVSTRPLISKSSRPFNNPLVIVPNAPITNWHAFIIIIIIIIINIIIIIIIIFTTVHGFPIGFNKRLFTEIWETASLLRSPGLVSVSKPILTVLCFEWSGVFFWFRVAPVTSRFLRIVPSAPTTIGITVTFMFPYFFSCKNQAFVYLFTLSSFLSMARYDGKIH